MKRESTFVICRHCGQKVYHKASRCPGCRRRMRLTDSDWQKIMVTIVLLVLVAALIWVVAINSEI